VTRLRKMMLEELQRRNYSQDTTRHYIRTVEDAASGQSLIQELKNSTALPVKPVKVDRDKVSRAYAVTPLCEAGRVYLPQGAPWLANFLDEHSSFDKGVHDDQVDTTTQALNYFRGSGPPGIFLFHQEWAAEREQTEAQVPS
jgi:predicted phage terminase large subunit-like protein